MWALFDYCCQGNLLGNLKTFKTEFEQTIIKGSDREASEAEKQLGVSVSQQLYQLIAPHFLRREKKQVFANNDQQQKQQPQQQQFSESVSGEEEEDDDDDNVESKKKQKQKQAKHNDKQQNGADSNKGNDVNGSDKSHNHHNSKKNGTWLDCRKNDFIVWLSITEQQKAIYHSFLQSEQVQNVSHFLSTLLSTLFCPALPCPAYSSSVSAFCLILWS